jgi:hypothetical protein
VRHAPLIHLFLSLCLIATPVSAQILLNEYLSANVDGITDQDGDLEDWIELLNAGPSSANLGGLYLSDDPDEPYLWPLPTLDLAPGAQLLIFASGKDHDFGELHCNFKLSSQNEETLILSDALGLPVDVLSTVPLPRGVSRGREPAGGSTWLYFDPPSPGAPNSGDGGSAIPEAPLFSPDGGFHGGGLSVTLFHSEAEAEIRYTLDGSAPGLLSTLYLEPVALDTTTVLRARAYLPGQIAGRIATRGFMVGESTDLPVVFVTTDPPHLWDWETGIYVMGPDADAEFPHFGANFWRDWEKPVHMDFYESDGEPGFRFEGGMKIHGGWSRAFEQKSLRLYARDCYGQDEISHRIFPRRENDSYQTLLLRNAGQDWDRASMRDPLAHLLSAELDIEWADSRPARIYLNGVYWGFLYLRERQDKFFFQANNGADPDEIDFLENNWTIIEGDRDHYAAMRSFLEFSDLSDGLVYAQVPQWLDVVNHASYTALEVWFANIDWPANNRRYWRPRDTDGTWRWVLHDLDHSLGRSVGPEHITLQEITNPNGSYPYGPYATMVFRELIESESYRNTFLNCLTEQMSSTLTAAHVNVQIDRFEALIGTEIPRHRDRWNMGYSGEWPENVALVRDFAERRSPYLRAEAMTVFGLADTLQLTLEIDPPGAGSIQLTSIEIDSTWPAIYFAGVPVPLEARPAAGWTFGGWSGATLPDEAAVVLTPGEDLTVTAHFESAPEVVINEINYHSADNFDTGDWIELLCMALGPVDLGGYVFKDEEDEHAFTIPEGTILDPGEFLVLCRDLAEFEQLFPEVGTAIGDLEFGLGNGGEQLRLFDSWGNQVDELRYDDVPPWPVEPDGEGPTLELMYPGGDNAHPASWAASEEHGTPGAENSCLDGLAIPDGSTPAATAILGAWPNPFNPAVSLSIALGKAGRLRLTIHDIQGREVARPAEGLFESGHHDIIWRAEGLASGVYLACLESEGVTDTWKLILLR